MNERAPAKIRSRTNTNSPWHAYQQGELMVWWLAHNDKQDAPKAAKIVCKGNGILKKLQGVIPAKVADRGLEDDESVLFDEGPNERLDIALVDANDRDNGFFVIDSKKPIGNAETIPLNKRCDEPSPSHIVLRNSLGDPGTPSAKLLMPTFAHELFHALQFAFYARGVCLEKEGKYKWIMESTAEWAAHYIYPKSYEHQFADEYFAFPARSLDDSDNQHLYGSYVFWLFASTRYGGPSVITSAWDRVSAGDDQFTAVDQALNGDFVSAWSKFGFESYPNPPYVETSYLRNWGGTPVQGAAVRAPYDIVPVGTKTKLSRYVQRVGTRYWGLDFPDRDIVRIDVNNGYTSSDVEVQALVKYRGEVWKSQPLTIGPSKRFCKPLDTLILIVSNAEHAASAQDPPKDLLTVETFSAANGCRGRQSCQPRTQQDEAGCEAGVLTGTITETVNRRRWDRDDSDGSTSEGEESMTTTLQMRLQPGANEWDEWIDLGSAWTINGSSSWSSDDSYNGCHHEGSSELRGSGTTEPPSPEELENGVYRTNYVFFGRNGDETYSFVMELMEGEEGASSSHSSQSEACFGGAGGGSTTHATASGMSGGSSTFTKDADGRLTINFNSTYSSETSTGSYEQTLTGTLTQS